MRVAGAIVAGVLISGLSGAGIAGQIDTTLSAGEGSGMYTLQNLYDYLLSGTALEVKTSFQEPGAGPGSTMKSFAQIGEDISAQFNQCDATTADVLPGKKFFSTQPGQWGVQTGAVPGRSLSSGTTSQPAGYYNAFDLATVDPDLSAQNVKSGVSIYGVGGTSVEATGNAAAGDVLAGKAFSKTGQAGLTGTMPNQGAVTITPGPTQQTIPAGYHNGGGYVAGDADLVPGNIRSGADIFGVSGNSNVVNTSSGTAAAGDIKNGMKAWVQGSEITGNLTLSGNAGAADVKNGKTFYSNSLSQQSGTLTALDPPTTQILTTYYQDSAGGMVWRSAQSGSFTNLTSRVVLDVCTGECIASAYAGCQILIDGTSQLLLEKSSSVDFGCTSRTLDLTPGSHTYDFQYKSGNTRGLYHWMLVHSKQ